MHSSLSQVGANRPQASAAVAFITDHRHQNSSSCSHYNAEKRFICKREGYRSINHIPQERVRALRKNRHIRQLVTEIIDDDTPGSTDAELADAREEVILHMQRTDADFGNDNTIFEP